MFNIIFCYLVSLLLCKDVKLSNKFVLNLEVIITILMI